VGSVDGGTAGARRAARGAARFRWYTAGVAALAAFVVGLLVVSSDRLPERADAITALWLALAFVLARWAAIEVEIRRDSMRITTVEIPLVFGLFQTIPLVVVIAYSSVLLVACLRRRDPPAKLIFNVSNAALLASIAGLLKETAEQRWLAAQTPEWAAVLIGVSVASALASGLLLVAFALQPGARRFVDAARMTLHLYVVGILNSVVGLVLVELASRDAWGWLLAGLFVVALMAIYYAYYGLLREQRDLGLLSNLSLVVSGAGRAIETAAWRPKPPPSPEPDEWLPAAELIREQLNAVRVVLHRAAFPDDGVRTVVAGEPLPESAPRDDPEILHSKVLAGAAGGGVQHLKINDVTGELRRQLELRGAKEALVVPLRGAQQLLGILEVHELQSRLRGFSAADVRLVGTLASHLATALDNRRLLGRLSHDAYHDLLTGLRNRLGFRQAVAEQLRPGRSAAVVVFDLGMLSHVNDALGHAWGDRTVLAAASRLRACVGEEVLAARLEDDTFAVLLLDVDTDEALSIAERLRDALSQPYPMEKLALECTAMAGIAMTTIEPTTDVAVLLQRADVALHAARSGEPKVRTYLPTMGQILLRRFQLVTHFRGALDAGQVALNYQPKVALDSKQVIGVEALVRWAHPEFGPVDPAEFVSAVETTGLVEALTDFVLDRALDRCRRWLDDGLRLGVAVNLSVRNLDDPQFPRRVDEALAAHRVPANLLTFELTESAVMRDAERALPVLRQLDEMGVGLAVDDFGTGYSSLAYLRRLPVNQVKIDKTFVLGMGSDLSDMAVVRAIVDLGHTLSLTVVAEGVEEDAVRDQLARMGCDVGQGYLFCRPLEERRFDSWLQARTMRIPDLRSDHDVAVLLH
jgi:diguanylate cyclase (GGDEF)-like protein